MKQRQTIFTDEELKQAYKELKTLGKIAVHFNVPHITIHRRCAKLGISFRENMGCGKKRDLQDILDGRHPEYPTIKLKHRLIKEGILENKCSNCKIKEWNNKPLILQLDHINGVNHDHRLDNLRLMCPNCHSQTPTFCGRNK